MKIRNTPLPGNPLRKQVLDALHKEVKLIYGIDVVFVVKHLKVKDGGSISTSAN